MSRRKSTPRLIHGNLTTDGLKTSCHRNQCWVIARSIRKIGSHNDLSGTNIRASIPNHIQESVADMDATPTHINRYGIHSGSKLGSTDRKLSIHRNVSRNIQCIACGGRVRILTNSQLGQCVACIRKLPLQKSSCSSIGQQEGIHSGGYRASRTVSNKDVPIPRQSLPCKGTHQYILLSLKASCIVSHGNIEISPSRRIQQIFTRIGTHVDASLHIGNRTSRIGSQRNGFSYIVGIGCCTISHKQVIGHVGGRHQRLDTHRSRSTLNEITIAGWIGTQSQNKIAC